MKLDGVTVKNFGPYLEADADLSTISAAVILGANGAGKSTFFVDAVLWGLFGYCRTSPDAIMRIGATDMMVHVRWRLTGQRYAVIRKRSKRSGKTDLELMVQQEDGSWQSISGSRLADTQQKIHDLLNADYDLLTVTGFILQGQADAFTSTTPANRKQVLANVLRSSRYPLLRTAASRASQFAQGQMDSFTESIKKAQGVADELPALKQMEVDTIEGIRQAEESATRTEHARIGELTRLTEARQSIDHLTTIVIRLEPLRVQYTEKEARAQAALSRLTEAVTILASKDVIRQAEQSAKVLNDRLQGSLVQGAAEARAFLAMLPEVETQLRQARLGQTSTRDQITAVNARVERVGKLLEQKETIRKKAEEHAALTAEGKTVQGQIETLTDSLNSVLEPHIADLRKRMTMIAELQMRRQQTEITISGEVGRYLTETRLMQESLDRESQAVAGQRTDQCGPEAKEFCQFVRRAAEETQRLKETQAQIDRRARNQEAIATLVASSYVEVLAKINADLGEANPEHTEALLNGQISEQAKVIADKNALLDRQKAITAQRQLVEEWTILIPELDVAEEEDRRLRDELVRAERDLTGYEGQVVALEARLGQRTSQEAVITECTTVQTELAGLARLTDQIPALEAAEKAEAQLRADVASADRDVKAVRDEIASIETQVQLRDTWERTKQQAESEMTRLAEQSKKLIAQIGDLRAGLGRLQERIGSAETASTEIEELRKHAEVAQADVRAYDVLAEAYSLIPVLILENAIPLLESETNRLLAKLSSKGMQVRLDTQKTLKSRDGLAETLDIIVRDVAGERPYEAYSGGERFRLDLALRVGLAKMLAHRAGARIETLIVDEGFGSLDPEGLRQVRECLTMLQEEFALILLITHVHEMKNVFPIHIYAESGQIVPDTQMKMIA